VPLVRDRGRRACKLQREDDRWAWLTGSKVILLSCYVLKVSEISFR
jgi:hypothetical protein